MLKLTKIESSFIKSQRLTPDDLFDATGLTFADRKKTMKELGKIIAFGVTPCAVMGHRLRTRAGHCIQCDPSKLAYQTRHSAPGDVYVAWTKTGRIVKVGCGKDADARLKTLVNQRYGGHIDWTLELVYECPEAGLIEAAVIKILNKYKIQGIMRAANGKKQECKELFSCTRKAAIAALESAVIEYTNSL